MFTRAPSQTSHIHGPLESTLVDSGGPENVTNSPGPLSPFVEAFQRSQFTARHEFRKFYDSVSQWTQLSPRSSKQRIRKRAHENSPRRSRLSAVGHSSDHWSRTERYRKSLVDNSPQTHCESVPSLEHGATPSTRTPSMDSASQHYPSESYGAVSANDQPREHVDLAVSEYTGVAADQPNEEHENSISYTTGRIRNYSPVSHTDGTYQENYHASSPYAEKFPHIHQDSYHDQGSYKKEEDTPSRGQRNGEHSPYTIEADEYRQLIYQRRRSSVLEPIDNQEEYRYSAAGSSTSFRRYTLQQNATAERPLHASYAGRSLQHRVTEEGERLENLQHSLNDVLKTASELSSRMNDNDKKRVSIVRSPYPDSSNAQTAFSPDERTHEVHSPNVPQGIPLSDVDRGSRRDRLSLSQPDSETRRASRYSAETPRTQLSRHLKRFTIGARSPRANSRSPETRMTASPHSRTPVRYTPYGLSMRRISYSAVSYSPSLQDINDTSRTRLRSTRLIRCPDGSTIPNPIWQEIYGEDTALEPKSAESSPDHRVSPQSNYQQIQSSPTFDQNPVTIQYIGHTLTPYIIPSPSSPSSGRIQKPASTPSANTRLRTAIIKSREDRASIYSNGKADYWNDPSNSHRRQSSAGSPARSQSLSQHINPRSHASPIPSRVNATAQLAPRHDANRMSVHASANDEDFWQTTVSTNSVPTTSLTARLFKIAEEEKQERAYFSRNRH